MHFNLDKFWANIFYGKSLENSFEFLRKFIGEIEWSLKLARSASRPLD